MLRMVTIGRVGAAPHIGAVLYTLLLTLPLINYLTSLYLSFISVNKPTDQTTEPICTHDISNDADCSKEMPFGCLINKNFSQGISIPKIFEGHFTCKSKMSNNFGQIKDNRKIPKPTCTKLGVKESNGDFTSGLARPLAAEIVFLPFSAITKARIMSKRYKIDGTRSTK
jgi:hypothetical protein